MGIMPVYANNPRWTYARFKSTCPCGQPIKPHDPIFHYPAARQALCETCGKKIEAELKAARTNEDNLNGGAAC